MHNVWVQFIQPALLVMAGYLQLDHSEVVSMYFMCAAAAFGAAGASHSKWSFYQRFRMVFFGTLVACMSVSAAYATGHADKAWIALVVAVVIAYFEQGFAVLIEPIAKKLGRKL